ncbi:unconventional myosin-IXb-like [Panonychus citri]|uniref:unconventional myosin-IXb-like n=1 Tax=Panonychus citri TaxID=50023 RepID=UPI0023076C6C|nr:unconventional myosin-IXb-like [Panonychus citri]
MSNDRFVLQVYVGAFSRLYEALSIEASKQTTTEEIIECIAEKLSLRDANSYELAEVILGHEGEDCKERRIGPSECPVALQLLWPLNPKCNNNQGIPKDGKNKDIFSGFIGPEYRFCLRRKLIQQCMNWSFSWTDSNDSQLLKDYFLRFLYQPRDREYPDLCQLPDLTEQTLLENLKARFEKGHIYTYVGSILIAVNPFKFYPIYNPKYVQLYQNRRLGDLPPHIFAIADAAYQAMLRKRCNQCIVISGESGSGKTESTNLLLHHLTALSQKGSHGSGVEQTILGAGPVLEAFGNAKTKHNNNSSRFGKFIQVNYKENGMVHGAVVLKYLLEKSRIVSQAKNERNYHVFYYLLAGADSADKEAFYLTKASDYFYLNQSKCYTLEGVDEAYEFSRLKQSLEMVGFSREKQRRLYAVLSAVLHLGNVEFTKKSTYHSDETVMVQNVEAVSTISKLLMVKEETLLSALTCKRTKAAKGETIIINYKMADAVATRDAMAKCLYGALFDWIVMQVNQSLLSKKEARDHRGNYIGVLDIFGFEDFGDQNYFEQFCINFANEHLHHYFNQHVFKYEQEEYRREGINWKSIDFHDNVGCLNLIEGRPQGLLCLLDDQCNFPGASNSTVLQKFVNHHQNNPLFEVPPCRQSAFVIKHYAGKVKYQIKDFREKNMDLMRPDIVCLLKSSTSAFVRELVGSDPLAIFRWQILKAFFKSYFVFTKLREQSKQRKVVQRKPITKSTKLTKPSSFKSNRNGIEKSIKSLQTLKLIVGKTNYLPPLGRTGRKQTPTVTAQFQQSLNQLMETLNQANPFFVRCIKSNADKIPYHFDDMLVLVQLRYTGMLETVTIRQSGYSVRLSFDEFITHYRILLPKGLLSSQADVRHFLERMNLNRDNYQIGKTKIFMRESEKLALDDMLHQEILRRIIVLQRWVRTWITRKRFQQMRQASVVLQTHVRRWLAQQRLNQLKWIAHLEHLAATIIQRNWRCYHARQCFLKLRRATVMFQSYARGFITRRKYNSDYLDQRGRKNSNSQSHSYSHSHGISSSLYGSGGQDSHSSHSDEAFLSKGSSQEELEVDRSMTINSHQHRYLSHLSSSSSSSMARHPSTGKSLAKKQHSKDSEDSSGIHEDSEPESFHVGENSYLPSMTNTKSSNNTNTTKTTGNIRNRSSGDEPPPPLPPRRQPPLPLTIPSSTTEHRTYAERPHHFLSSSYNSSLITSSQQPSSLPPVPTSMSQFSPHLSGSSPPQSLQPIVSPSSTTSPTTPPSPQPLKSLQPNQIPLPSDKYNLPSPTEDLDDKPRLDRRRSRPFRKVSLKRSKSNKSPTSPIASETIGGHEKVAKTPSEADITIVKKPIKEMISEPCIPTSPSKIHPPDSFLSSSESGSTTGTRDQKGAFQKAKKHIRTFIIGSSSSKTEKKSKAEGASHSWEPENQSSLYPPEESHNNQIILSSQIKSKKSKPSPLYSSLLPTSILTSSTTSTPSPPTTATPSSTCSTNTPSSEPLSGPHFSSITRHNLKSALSFQKSDICALCEKAMLQGLSSTLQKQQNHHQQKQQQKQQQQQHQKQQTGNSGFRCGECSLLFHTTCLSNANSVPCIDKSKLALFSSSKITVAHNPSRPPRNKTRGKGSKNYGDPGKENLSLSPKHDSMSISTGSSVSGSGNTNGGGSNSSSSWNVTRTTEFIDPKDILITDVTELHYMEIFINNKIMAMEESKKNCSKESMVDVVFKIALKEFKSNLLSTYSVAAAQDGQLHIAYKNLIDHFGQVIMNVCQKENTWKSFPVIMGVNAFRGFLDEFRNLGAKVPPEDAKQKSKRRKRGNNGGGNNIGGGNNNNSNKKKESREEFIIKCDHKFISMMANIPTVCEVCSTLMWLTEKIWVCQGCKFTCHKKCTSKVTVSCRDKTLLQQGKKLFGAPLERLVSDEIRIPTILENLITAIELRGLYTEGIYRKSGTTSKINELKAKLEENIESVDLDSYSVHVLTAVLKSFFREMANPLMTYQLYDDFLWTTAISDPAERIQAIYSHIAKLPRANYDVLERLFFHLARVAQQEAANRMNANSLAIVFAPCILRTDKLMQMQDKLSDISKQTICIETIINDRLKQVKDTLADIEMLDSVYHTTSSRLSSLKMSKSQLNRDNAIQASRSSQQDEEEVLTQQIDHLRNEKAHLTNILPTFNLVSAGSDEDLLSTGTELESSLGTSLDEVSLYSNAKTPTSLRSNQNCDLPSLPSIQQSVNLNHLTKSRVSQAPQNRRLPSRFSKPIRGGPLPRLGRSPVRRRRDQTKDSQREGMRVYRNDDNSVRV